MGSETTYKGKIEGWDYLQERLTANATDLAHLDTLRKRLDEVTEQARQMAAAQAAQRAAKQSASQTLKSTVIEGERLANLLRSAVKQHYGIRSEKLAEFGLRPFRGRNRTAKAKETGETTPQSQLPAPPATPPHAEASESAAE
jgi:hypothetical protein